MDDRLVAFAQQGIESLHDDDPLLYQLLHREHQRQGRVLTMVAASSIADPAVLACESMVLANVTTEGYPGARFHAGCAVVDEIEQLALARARAAFGAVYANVQPHSGSSANEIVLFSLLRPGDTLLGQELSAGGHLTHGARASVAGQYFQAVGYGLGPDGLLDYDQVARLAHAHRPRLIICGASAYPRTIDFARFRAIADEVGAYLLADISHIAGLVASGVHPSPIPHAHFTTTSTYKQLYGPRGGLILMGAAADQPAPDGKRSLADSIQRAVFPFFQGTPSLGSIAAKARALAWVATPAFRTLAERIVDDAQALAAALLARDYQVLTGGTDNHMILIDVAARGLTGVIAEQALEECGIIVNKNRIPGDIRPALITSGLRLGTNTLARRGLSPAAMATCADLVDRVLRAVSPLDETTYLLDPLARDSVHAAVQQICARYPLPGYPAPMGAPVLEPVR